MSLDYRSESLPSLQKKCGSGLTFTGDANPKPTTKRSHKSLYKQLELEDKHMGENKAFAWLVACLNCSAESGNLAAARRRLQRVSSYYSFALPLSERLEKGSY